MTKPDRSAESMERLFEAIRRFGAKHPDYSVQTIVNATLIAAMPADKEEWADYENDELAALIDRMELK